MLQCLLASGLNSRGANSACLGLDKLSPGHFSPLSRARGRAAGEMPAAHFSCRVGVSRLGCTMRPQSQGEGLVVQMAMVGPLAQPGLETPTRYRTPERRSISPSPVRGRGVTVGGLRSCGSCTLWAGIGACNAGGRSRVGAPHFVHPPFGGTYLYLGNM
jgi:hypothetical protein